jgi:hypothetical protein
MTRPKSRRPSTALPEASTGVQSDTSLDNVTDPVELAKLTLQAICRDAKAPAAARAQSARTLLELSGALRNGSPDTRRAASEITLEELDARLEELARHQTPDTGSHGPGRA